MTFGAICPHRQGRERTRAIPHVASVGPGVRAFRGRAERAGATASGKIGDTVKLAYVPYCAFTLVRTNQNIYFTLPDTRNGLTRLRLRVNDSFYSSRSLKANFALSANFPLALTGSHLVTAPPRRSHLYPTFRPPPPFCVSVFAHFLSTPSPTKIMASPLLKAVVEGDFNAVLAILQSPQSADIELAGTFGFFRSPPR
jgi:hypothetical protein